MLKAMLKEVHMEERDSPDRKVQGRGSASVALRALPVVVSSWLAGAHYLRVFALGIVVMYFALPLLLLVPRAWAIRVLQVGLVLATLAWLRTTYALVSERMALGEPWTRMALILGAVTALTLISVLLLESGPFRRRYSLRTGEAFR
jgi:hypothetical protein